MIDPSILRDLRVANFAIADACLVLKDITAGDYAGEIENESAKRELELMRLRFQSLAFFSANLIEQIIERNK